MLGPPEHELVRAETHAVRRERRRHSPVAQVPTHLEEACAGGERREFGTQQRCHARFTVEVQVPADPPLRPLRRVAERRQHETLQRGQLRRRRGDQVASLLDFALQCDLVRLHIAGLGGRERRWVFQKLSEIRHAEDGVGAGKGGFQRGLVIEVCGDDFDAGGLKCGGGGAGRVASQTSDAPVGILGVERGNGPALQAGGANDDEELWTSHGEALKGPRRLKRL
nr:hypothetical protein CFP56_60776 [Quercus suber]